MPVLMTCTLQICAIMFWDRSSHFDFTYFACVFIIGGHKDAQEGATVTMLSVRAQCPNAVKGIPRRDTKEGVRERKNHHSAKKSVRIHDPTP
jgi:hypothetical protein